MHFKNMPSIGSEQVRVVWASLRHPAVRPWLKRYGLTFVVGSTVLWLFVLELVNVQRDHAVELVRQQAQVRAHAYGRQIDDLMDRLTRAGEAMMANWRAQPDRIDFEKILVGVYPQGQRLFVTFYDASGRVTAASYAPQVAGVSRPAFLEHHRAHCCDGWHITPPEFSPNTNSIIIRLSHRLSHEDGTFAGALVFGLSPDFVNSFQDVAFFAPQDLISLRLKDGVLLAAKCGAKTGNGMRSLYKAPPQFDALDGVRLEAGHQFIDGKARYVGWHQHPTMPLVVLAGVSGEKVLAGAEAGVRAYYVIGAATTILLLLVCCAAILSVAQRIDRRRAEEEVRQVYRAATDAANEGFLMLRPVMDASNTVIDVQVEDCNERAGELLSSSRAALVGNNAGSALPLTVFTELLDVVGRAVTYGSHEDERRLPTRKKIPARWLQRRAFFLKKGVALTLRDISESKSHMEELQTLAHRDTLTGLPNRQWLRQFLPGALRRASRARVQLALMFVDLDNFKAVNDVLGHESGDELLRDVAAHLQSSVRASDHVIRIGGDEFVIIIEQSDSELVAESLAEKINETLKQALSTGGGPRSRVNASIGVVLFPDDGEDMDLLLRHADIAMYAAKAAGRARYCRYRPEMSAAINERFALEEALHGAVARCEWVLYFQPKIYARTGKLRGFEALIRWCHPQRGLLAPAEFIPLAEELGLVNIIGQQVIQMALMTWAHWQSNGLRPMQIAINVSPTQLRGSDVAAIVQEALDSHKIDASWVDIEITESAMVDDSPVSQAQLEKLRSLGVKLIIDDFGAGYSSLSRLQKLKADGIKIDQGFIETLVTEPATAALYRATVSMASALNLEVVAEGVETTEQLEALLDVGCDAVQGHLVSLPLAEADALLFARKLQAEPFDWRCLPLFAVLDEKGGAAKSVHASPWPRQ